METVLTKIVITLATVLFFLQDAIAKLVSLKYTGYLDSYAANINVLRY